MAFSSLPVEIIIEVVENLDKEQDINSLSCVSSKFCNLFDDHWQKNKRRRGGKGSPEGGPDLDGVFWRWGDSRFTFVSLI